MSGIVNASRVDADPHHVGILATLQSQHDATTGLAGPQRNQARMIVRRARRAVFPEHRQFDFLTGFTDDLGTAIAQHLQGGIIDVHDPAGGVVNDDALQRSCQERREKAVSE